MATQLPEPFRGPSKPPSKKEDCGKGTWCCWRRLAQDLPRVPHYCVGPTEGIQKRSGRRFVSALFVFRGNVHQLGITSCCPGLMVFESLSLSRLALKIFMYSFAFP